MNLKLPDEEIKKSRKFDDAHCDSDEDFQEDEENAMKRKLLKV